MATLELLTTEHCQLCDDAFDVLLASPGLRGAQLKTTDIALDDALVAQYGERLPVLRLGASELDWPFDVEAVHNFLQGAQR